MSHKIQIRLCNFSHRFIHPYAMPQDEHQNQYVKLNTCDAIESGATKMLITDLIGQRVYCFDNP